MLKHVWRNRYIELFSRQGRLLRNAIAEINIIGKNFSGVGELEILEGSGVVWIINEAPVTSM